MKKQSEDSKLQEHGYYVYACGRNGQYALHFCGEESPKSYRGTFKTKKAAIEFAYKLPKIS